MLTNDAFALTIAFMVFGSVAFARAKSLTFARMSLALDFGKNWAGWSVEFAKLSRTRIWTGCIFKRECQYFRLRRQLSGKATAIFR